MLKFKVVLSILLTAGLFILLLTNIVERRSIHALENKIESIINDRLVAESYLLKMYDNIHAQQMYILNYAEGCIQPSEFSALLRYEKRFTQFIDSFSQTQLTEDEGILFHKLDSVVQTIDQLEAQLSVENDSAVVVAEILELNSKIMEVEGLVLELSDIQTEVGKELQKESHNLIIGANSEIEFELAVLILIALIIQLLILTVRSVKDKEQNQTPNLN